MTFFANSGVAWPDHESETASAGTQSLEAISQIWKLLSDLESRRDGSPIPTEVGPIIEKLTGAAVVYSRIARSLEEVRPQVVSLAELELAGVQGYSFFDPGLARIFRRCLTSIRLSDDNELKIGYLYSELAQRSDNLARSLRLVEVSRSNLDLAPQMFQIMSQIESWSELGRVIAVVNRRKGDSVERSR